MSSALISSPRTGRAAAVRAATCWLSRRVTDKGYATKAKAWQTTVKKTKAAEGMVRGNAPLIVSGLGVSFHSTLLKMNQNFDDYRWWATMKDALKTFRWQCLLHVRSLNEPAVWAESGLTMMIFHLKGDPLIFRGFDLDNPARVFKGWEIGLLFFGIGRAHLISADAPGRPYMTWLSFTLGVRFGYREYDSGAFVPVGDSARPEHRIFSRYSINDLFALSVVSFMVAYWLVVSIMFGWMSFQQRKVDYGEFTEELDRMKAAYRREFLWGNLSALSHLTNLIGQAECIAAGDLKERESLEQLRKEGKLLDLDEDRYRIWGHLKSDKPFYGEEKKSSPADRIAAEVLSEGK